jgi:hypothetical protein
MGYHPFLGLHRCAMSENGLFYGIVIIYLTKVKLMSYIHVC